MSYHFFTFIDVYLHVLLISSFLAKTLYLSTFEYIRTRVQSPPDNEEFELKKVNKIVSV